MPGFDRTGPIGAGPGTGRRLGRCLGFSGRNRPRRGLCQRFGFGFGFGRRGMSSYLNEKEALLEEKSWLEKRLDSIKERLSALA